MLTNNAFVAHFFLICASLADPSRHDTMKQDDKERANDDALDSLISACRKNDREAQFVLYRKFARTMYNTCYRMLKNNEDAEDVMQESFLSAFRKIGTYGGQVPFDAWLRRIVINRSLDHLRAGKNLKFESSDTLEIPVEDFSEDPGQITYELKTRMMHGLMKLAEGYRVIINLYYFEGYDHEEIASILRISPATSRSQLARARKKLSALVNN